MAEKVRCVIICGSPERDTDFIKSFVKPETDYIICADSGYETALKAGITPDLFVGDFDSYSGVIADNTEIIKLNTIKDDTDTMHCAEVALNKGFKNVVLLSATGGRFDHTIANMCVLKYLCKNGVSASVESVSESIIFSDGGERRFKNLCGKTFSVIPFGCESAVVSYIGDVEYTAEELELKSDDVLGVSNVFKNNDVNIKISGGEALIIINNTIT